VALVEQPTPENLLTAVQKHGATTLFTAATAYRNMAAAVPNYDLSSLRRCISAGEALPKATSDAWHDATGIRIIDGIGATEIFTSSSRPPARRSGRARLASRCPATRRACWTIKIGRCPEAAPAAWQ